MSQANNDYLKILRQNLFLLGLNFNATDENTRDVYKRFTPPTLEEAQSYRESRDSVHPKLSEMIQGDAAMRLYAAILLKEVDREKSLDILNQLANDETKIKVQLLVGHGLTQVPVKYPARSFLKTGDIRKGFIEKAEILDKWKIAIHDEAKEKNSPPEIERLPTVAQIVDSDENAAESANLKNELLKLANDELISKRFYAAAALEDIDETGSRKILESLLDEETKLLILYGDIGQRLPASRIAREILYSEPSVETGFKSQNALGKFVEWLSNLTGGK